MIDWRILNPGDFLKDNDPREPNRILRIINVTPSSVLASDHINRVRTYLIKRIWPFDVDRRSGLKHIPHNLRVPHTESWNTSIDPAIVVARTSVHIDLKIPTAAACARILMQREQLNGRATGTSIQTIPRKRK